MSTLSVAIMHPDIEHNFLGIAVFNLKNDTFENVHFINPFVGFKLQQAIAKHLNEYPRFDLMINVFMAIHKQNGYVPEDCVVSALQALNSMNVSFPVTLELDFNIDCSTPEQAVYHWYTALLEDGGITDEECDETRETCRSLLNMQQEG